MRQLILEKRTMIHVSLGNRVYHCEPQTKAPLLTRKKMRSFCRGLDLRDCSVLDVLVQGECNRRGYGRRRVGDAAYCAVEAAVCADVVALAIDLKEIGAQIEEARWERGE